MARWKIAALDFVPMGMTQRVRDAILLSTARLHSRLQPQTGVLCAIGPASLRLGRQAVGEDRGVLAREVQLLLRIGLVLAPPTLGSVRDLLSKLASCLLRLLECSSVEARLFGLSLQSHEVSPPLDLFTRIPGAGSPHFCMWVLEEVVSLRVASFLPTLDLGGREVKHLHMSLSRLIFPAADHGGGHDLLLGAEYMNAHRVASQFHPEAVDVRETDNEVKLVQVDNHERDLLAEGGANVQKYPHLPLRRLKRPVAIHNAKMM